MKTIRRGITALVLLAAAQAGAVNTNTWEITNATHHYISPADKPYIMVDETNGVAKLILQADKNYRTTFEEYNTNGSSLTKVKLGPAMALSLKQSGSTYQSPGAYVSRIIDGGFNNQWQRLFSQASGRQVAGNSHRQTRGDMPGLKALCHFDNNWLEVVSNVNVASSGSFTTNAMIGVAAARFGGTGTLPNPTLLNNATSCTISCWVKMRVRQAYAGILCSRGSGNALNGFVQSANTDQRWAFRLYIKAGASQDATETKSVIDTDRWYFLVGTWSANNPIRVYLDTRFERQSSALMPGAIQQDDFFKLAYDDFSGVRISQCDIDEVAIFDRVLSGKEMLDLYQLTYSFMFQLRSGSDTGTLTSAEFTGPDGTTNSFYINDAEVLATAGSLDVTNRYAQYKAYLYSDLNGTATPWIEAIALFGDRATEYDYTMLDYRLGTYDANITNFPAQSDTPYVGLVVRDNGGFKTNGSYMSGIFTATNDVTWEYLGWEENTALNENTPGLVALYHLDTSWSDSQTVEGGDNSGTVTGNPFANPKAEYAKLGSGCSPFDGSVSVTGFGITNLLTIEFWISDDNPNDGIMRVGIYSNGESRIAITNGYIVAEGFQEAVPKVFVNGIVGSRRLVAGWNHVAVVFERAVIANGLTVGVVSGDYMNGLLDEMAIYVRELSSVEIKSHHLLGREGSAGAQAFQYRAASTEADITNAAWSASLGDPTAINTNGKAFQYRVLLYGDGDSTPTFRNVNVRYFDGVQTVTMRDAIRDEVVDGDFGDRSSRWYGDEVKLVNQSSWGPANLPATYDASMRAVWHLDEDTWGSVSNKAASGGLHGNAYGDVYPTADSKVGLRCAIFDGSNDYLIVGAPTIDAGDFTVGAWFRSSATNRAGLISTYNGTTHYTIEYNGNGFAIDLGRVAFVLNDGTTQMVAVSSIGGLHDDRWHHVAGVRDGSAMHLYVDGDRVSSRYLGGGFSSVGSGSPYIGRYGTLGLQYDFKGYIDEVVAFTRALSDGEVGEVAGSAFKTRDLGEYVSDPIDAKRPAIWETLSWGADAPYGRCLSPSEDTDLVGLWSFESNVIDSAGSYDATLAGNAAYTGSGRLGAGLTLDGDNDWANVTDAAALEPSTLSIEAWVYLAAVEGRIVVDKSNGSNQGYRLATDSSGYPYFRVGALECKDPVLILRKNAWVHLAGTYGPAGAALYVNGQIRARATGAATIADGSDLRMGADSGGAGDLAGRIDEVALHRRVLSPREILDHYKAGAMTMRLQARAAADTTTLAATPWMGSTGNGSYFTYSKGESLLNLIPLGQYFQYRVQMSTEDYRFTPKLQGVRVDASSYSTNNPAVEVATGYGLSFPGKLTMFSHTLRTNTDAAVRYQVTGDIGATTNWYFWWGSSNMWLNASIFGGGYEYANSRATVAANIGSLYRQIYEKTGGMLKWRAFLHSAGNDQVELDSVSAGYSEGRVVLTAPNGTETNKAAWLSGTTNFITWERGGVVPGTVSLRYTINGGSNWVDCESAPGVPATGIVATLDRVAWLTPGNESTNCFVRIDHDTDSTINDMSDGPFQLIKRYRVLKPNGGETWYIGETNVIVWGAAQGIGNVNLDFSGNDTWTNPVRIAQSAPSSGGSMSNSYTWVSPTTNVGLPSATARIRVQTPGGSYADYSDEFFTMAGGVFVAPGAGSKVKKDDYYNLTWKSAGCGSGVLIELQSQIGGPWAAIDTNAPNSDGINVYSWLVTNAPTEEGRLRITSLGDSRAKGMSEQFTIAAIDVINPRGHPDPNQSDRWLMGTTQRIEWVSAGASGFVNLHYSTDGGTNWTEIANKYLNSNVAGVTNYFLWPVVNDPSPFSRIRVQDWERPADLWSMSRWNFHIAGIRVLWPNGPVTQEWVKGASGVITWKQNSVGNNCVVELSDDGGLTWTNVVGMGVDLPLVDEAAPPFIPYTPTVRGLVRITPDLVGTTFSNVFDRSDSEFSIAGVKVLAPTGGVEYTLTTTNPVTFRGQMTHSPSFYADIYLASDGVNFDTNNPIKLDEIFDDEAYPGERTYSWVVEPTRTPSVTARVKVQAGSYSHVSEMFTLRGIRFNAPVAGTIWSPGLQDIMWTVAGLAGDCAGDLYLSTEGANPPAWTNQINAFLVSTEDGGTAWTVPADIEPTTNAVIRIVVTQSPSEPQDLDFQAFSQPFTLKGLRVVDPTNNASWAHGSAYTIRWKAASAGSAADIFYSADGGSNFTDIARSIASSNGYNTYTWTVERTRMPSTNAVIKIVTTEGLTAFSKVFTLQGLKITRPTKSDIFARSDPVNMIQWTVVGDSGPFDLYYVKDSVEYSIQAGVATNELNWIIPTNAISTNISIRVVGLVFANTSEVFRVVDAPTIAMISPADGAFWGIGLQHQVQWSRGGVMSNDFSIWYSLAPYISSNPIAGTVTFDPTNNMFSIPWTYINQPTNARIFVTHNALNGVSDLSGEFHLCGRFTVVSPNSNETFYARRPTPLTWKTIGAVSAVDVYYSITPPYAASSWIKANSTPVPNNYRLDLNEEATTWQWPVADVRSPNVRVRVQEAAYTNKFDGAELTSAGTERPCDDSDAAFTIRYYTVFWNIMDRVTTNKLDHVSVIDTSPWAASDLSCIPPYTISHDYPWGTWNTAWYREFFFDEVIMYWTSETLGNPPVWTQNVYMARSLIEPDYHVLASFSYEATNKTFTIHSWLERSGEILEGADSCTIRIYDENGNEIDTLINPAPQDNGMFWDIWDASALSDNAVYFAKVEIEFSGTIYSSGLTFQLRATLGSEIRSELLAVEARITNAVETVNTNLNAHEAAQAIFRADMRNAMAGLSNTIEEVAAMTNITDAIYSISNLVTQLQPLTNIGVVAGVLTNIQALVTDMAPVIENSAVRITSRAMTIKTGSTNQFLYKSGSGLGPLITVEDPLGAVRINQAAMTEILNTGIYRYEVVFDPLWGLGEFKIECRDSAAVGSPMDRIVVQVVSEDYWSDKASLASIAASLATMDGTLSNVWGVVQDLNMASNLNNIATAISNLESVVTNTVVSNINVLAMSINGIEATLGRVDSNVVYVMNVVSNIQVITNMLPAMTRIESGLSNTVLTEILLLAQDLSAVRTNTDTINWVDVTNILHRTEAINWADVTNILHMTEAINWADITDLQSVTNLNSLLVLTNLYTLSTDLNALIPLTNLYSVAGDVEWLTNAAFTIRAQTDTIEWSNVVDILANANIIMSDVKWGTNTALVIQGKTDTINWPDVVDILTNVNTVMSDVKWGTNAALVIQSKTDTIEWTNVVDILANVNTIMSDVKWGTNTALVIQNKTDTINWPDIVDILTNVNTIMSDVKWGTNTALVIQRKTDTIEWSNVVDILARANTIMSDVKWGTNTAAAIRAKTDTINWDNVLDILARANILVSDVQTITNTTFAIKAKTDTINWNNVTDIAAALADLQALSESSFGTIESELSRLAAMAGMLDSIYQQIDNVGRAVDEAGDSASEAARQARSAKTEAAGIMGAIASLRTAIGQGEKDTAMTILERIQQQMAALQSSSLGGGGKAPNLTPLMDMLSLLEQKMNELASKSDIQPLVKVDWDALRSDSTLNMENLVKIGNEIEKMKAMIAVLNSLVDRVANAPVVTEWWESQ